MAYAMRNTGELVGYAACEMARKRFRVFRQDIDGKYFARYDQIMDGCIQVDSYEYQGWSQG